MKKEKIYASDVTLFKDEYDEIKESLEREQKYYDLKSLAKDAMIVIKEEK